MSLIGYHHYPRKHIQPRAMAKEAFYFNHDYTARNDDKILELRANFGAEGYGIFWMIVETMAENEHGGLNASLLGGAIARLWGG